MICRRYQPDDKAAVIALLQECFGGWHGDLSEACWEWKFERNPHGAARIWVGDDDGRIAGCYILNPVRLSLNGTTILGAQSVDAAVHPDYRRVGLFRDLARTAIESSGDDGIDLVFAFPTEGAFKGQVRVGFEPRFAVPMTYRPLPPGVALRRRNNGLTLREAEAFDSRFDVFAENKNGQELTLRRDSRYLQWRYKENPTQTYETIVCERDGEVCGYSVVTLDGTKHRLSRGYLVDLQVLPKADTAAPYLVSNSLRRLRALGARLAVSWTRPSGPEQKALKSSGFSPRYASIRGRVKRPGYVNQFIVCEPERGKLPDSPQWSLVPGDADYV